MAEQYVRGDYARIVGAHFYRNAPGIVDRQDAHGNVNITLAGLNRTMWFNDLHVEKIDERTYALLAMSMAIGITPPEPLTLELSNG